MNTLKRLVLMSSLALGLTSGTALADHWRGGYHGGVYVRGGGYRPVVVERAYVRRPNIYVRGPVIRERYFNYYRRPTLVVESFGPREGYVWIRGHWAWNGYEWIWQAGYYQPVY